MLVIIISTILCITFGQVNDTTDACGNDITPVSPFDVSKYLGEWKQVAVNKAFFDLRQSEFPLCLTQLYELNPDGETLTITNTGYNEQGEKRVTQLQGESTQGLNVGEFIVYTPPFPPPTAPNYQILKLRGGYFKNDYRVTIFYGCDLIPPNTDISSLFVYTRSGKISNLQYLSLLRVAKLQGIDVKELEMIRNNQTDCDRFR